MTEWTITEADAGERLDVFLTQELPDRTRSAIQKIIRDGGVTVNDKPAAVHRFLKVGDMIKLVGADLVPALPARSTEGRPQGHAPTPTIVAETSDWLVIDKPAGLLVHPDAKTKTGTLIDWLIAHAPNIGRVGEDPERPGIVHRLDREVSGLMVVAKTQPAYDELKRQFASHDAKKTYVALVHGEVSKDFGDIKFKIARSASKARMAARPEHAETGRAAWTHYRVLKKFIGATLLEITILSGRTHQIRAHLQALGHPIMGDALYAAKHTPRNIQAPRLMLQSVGLSFHDPTGGQTRSFELAPDPAFDALVREFERS